MNDHFQPPLPQIYRHLSVPELRLRIAAAREALGERLVILGHHYQQDDVVAFADFVGDSFELSRRASEQSAQFVIFCGVHFMAESADILTDPSVRVILPDLGAGCSMADMAQIDPVSEAWDELHEIVASRRDGNDLPPTKIIPITYMNSSAALKAFVGEHGGAVCTSSNCREVLEWALRGASNAPRTSVSGGTQPSSREFNPTSTSIGSDSVASSRILFFPDQHLGRNTAHAMGFGLDEMVVWDPREPLGGNTIEQIGSARFILWKGHCSVHALFRPEHVDQAREKHPGIKVLVHPECKFDVVQKADMAGSTAYIVEQVRRAPAGTSWAIGTEVNLVNRLRQQHPDQHIIVLSDCQCLCTTMYRIDLPHLCWAIERLAEGEVVNEVRVDEHTRRWSLVALDRMLSLRGTGNPLGKSQPVGVFVD
jgi:quinolinate synthase